MRNEKLLHALQRKMESEQNAYRNWLLALSPHEILHHACEYIAREDILILLDDVELSDEQIRALLFSPTPLADVYKTFSKMDISLMDELRSCLEDRSDAMLQSQQERSDHAQSA